VPTYGYRCTACAHEFERFQKITEDPIRECESCGELVKRILYPAGIQFKGSGFYVTDYKGGGEKSNGSGSAKSGESGDGKASESGSEAKTEAKAETKTESKAESKPAAPASESK
jgi:putative FmdB family regulatory protein